MTDTVSRLQSSLADRYRIERELGQGGMATVYLAHDVRHDRKVALKVLRPELSAILGGERFLKEIRTTANLQHPHILALHDSGESEGLIYYVMPYVEGESLRDRLTREKQLSVTDALRIAREVADALHYAHGHGVIHRDIKPENILLHGGHAQVADFGIALAAARTEGGTRMTETGMSLGTPQYMAPEQAMGEREITPRCDIYALGCVTYEMLTGEPPFTGPTAQAIVARVMTEQPRSLTLQRHTIPAHVEDAVATALEKLPADRFATAAEFAEALEGGMAVGRYGGKKTAATKSVTALPAYRRTALVGAFAAGALLSFLALRGGTPDAQVLRLSMILPGESPPTAVRISPDGRMLAYSAPGTGDRFAIHIRRLDELTSRRLEGTEDAATLSFSPDGQWIAFSNFTHARKVSVNGGGSVPIVARAGNVFANVQYAGPDEFFVQTGNYSIGRLGADGEVTVFAAADSSRAFTLEHVLPDGRALAREWSTPPNGPVVAINARTGRRDTIINAVVAWAAYSDETMVWSTPDGTMYTAPVKLSSNRLTGPAVPIGGNLLSVLGFTPGGAFDHGLLVYAPTRPRSLVRVSRDGAVTPLLTTDRTYHSPRISPDGRRIALDFTDQQRDVWLYDLVDSTLTRFGFDSSAHDPLWLPDGKGIVFAAVRGNTIGIFQRRFAGGPRAEPLHFAGLQGTAHTVTPDGREFVASSLGSDGQFDVLRVRASGGFDTLLASSYNEGFATLSPNGRWLAYASDESGRLEVYVRAYPSMADKVQVSPDGGSEPVWSRDGRELFFRAAGPGEPRLVAATVETSPAFRVRSRTPLFPVSTYEFATPHANYDVFAGARSFVMVRQGTPGEHAEVVFVQGVPALARRGRN